MGSIPRAVNLGKCLAAFALHKGWVIRNGLLTRAAKDLSQQQLADLVGVTRQTINAVEKGDYNPTINLCIAICKALDKTLDELFWE